ncbi:MAG: hypothetical protein D6765_10735, partial [Bacteroidetes bacterium]
MRDNGKVPEQVRHQDPEKPGKKRFEPFGKGQAIKSNAWVHAVFVFAGESIRSSWSSRLGAGYRGREFPGKPRSDLLHFLSEGCFLLMTLQRLEDLPLPDGGFRSSPHFTRFSDSGEGRGGPGWGGR